MRKVNGCIGMGYESNTKATHKKFSNGFKNLIETFYR